MAKGDEAKLSFSRHVEYVCVSHIELIIKLKPTVGLPVNLKMGFFKQRTGL